MEEPILESSEANAAPPQKIAPSVTFKEILKNLAKLQEKDIEIAKIEVLIVAIPEKIQQQQAIIEQLQAEAQASKERGTQLLLERKNAEGRLAEIEQQIAKHGGELQQVKSNDAYKALLTEIETLKSKKDATENQILELFDQIEQAKKSEQAAFKTCEEKKGEAKEAIAALDQEKKRLEDNLAARQQTRSHLAGDLPVEALSRYEKLRERRAGVALAPLLDGSSCGGCRMRLTPGVINNLLKVKDFVTCERCQRIIYIPEQS